MATTTTIVLCSHCGADCGDLPITAGEQSFCCTGCQTVYSLLQEHALCGYYDLNKTPGIKQENPARADQFAILDDPSVAAKFIRYEDKDQIAARFYIPQLHCSSCIYLLENLPRFDPDILASTVHFTHKEIEIRARNLPGALKKSADWLARVGYEPYISLKDLDTKKAPANHSLLRQLGVAGFCFANIMLMSFPDYLGIDSSEAYLKDFFRWFNLLLALPVLFYSAMPFYTVAFKGLKHKYLNIDAPIVLAVWITFGRSLWDFFVHGGSGYFDSMTGIVFFMLAGRYLQDKTHRQLSFERNYESYLPLAVTVVENNSQQAVKLPDLACGQTIRIHHGELIPADGLLTRGRAEIDYSFVTGESAPVGREIGELIYAGGRQTGGMIELLVMKEVASSYLASLWSRDVKGDRRSEKASTEDKLSQYFTWIVFGIALLTGIWWAVNDPSKIGASVTSIFIIACPCALLLAASFTNGHILNLLARKGFFLRNAGVIDTIAHCDHIVFDKTGTLTVVNAPEISYQGIPLSPEEQTAVAALAACSGHPLSRAIARHLPTTYQVTVTDFTETPGQGIQGVVGNRQIRLGSAAFTQNNQLNASSVFIQIDDYQPGYFQFKNRYREGLTSNLRRLNTGFTVLSGDNDQEETALNQLFNQQAELHFRQTPADKMDHIQRLQEQGHTVMMIGDGLNDAGAFRQADAAIAVTEAHNNFTPASDAIMQASAFDKLAAFVAVCRGNRTLITIAFTFSIIYNLIGLWFAVQGRLSPMVAAILMPSSTLTIFLITYVGSWVLAKRHRLA
ncbi:MAG: heavy metal translocating P-type ATPase metal-binding domain-containing protein [Bacteroidetes bacterium]|nr:heavy metal translocating P-type ATPase metal-binding domain-containing protein [Bacteroidota bacterium]HOA37960.1 heavy metal translocating P-type ATPase metal-binding domain-containing protein [Flavihumibacter sp.]